jgi:hypothetical protein
MNDLTRSEITKQSEIQMSDGSVLTYNIDITIETNRVWSIATEKVKSFCNRDIEPIEQILADLLLEEKNNEDPEQQEQKVIDFYLQGGANPEDPLDEESNDEE